VVQKEIGLRPVRLGQDLLLIVDKYTSDLGLPSASDAVSISPHSHDKNRLGFCASRPFPHHNATDPQLLHSCNMAHSTCDDAAIAGGISEPDNEIEKSSQSEQQGSDNQEETREQQGSDNQEETREQQGSDNQEETREQQGSDNQEETREQQGSDNQEETCEQQEQEISDMVVETADYDSHHPPLCATTTDNVSERKDSSSKKISNFSRAKWASTRKTNRRAHTSLKGNRGVARKAKWRSDAPTKAVLKIPSAGKYYRPPSKTKRKSTCIAQKSQHGTADFPIYIDVAGDVGPYLCFQHSGAHGSL
jgi:hypothetical protein